MLDPKPIDDLIADLDQSSPIVRLSAQKQLIRLGNTVVQSLADTLYTGSSLQRAHTAIILGNLRDIRALTMLLELRNFPDPLIRIDSAKALGALNHLYAIAALIDWLAVESNVLVQAAIVQTLADTRLPQIFTPLVKTLIHTPSPSLKYQIIRVLGDLGETHAIEIIFPYAESTDYHIRREALLALEKLSATAQKEHEL